MTSLKKIFTISFVSATLIVVPMRSQAIVPLIAGWIMTATGGSILIADLIAGQVGVITAVLWWDCNKFALSAPCTSKAPIPSVQQPKPAITISLAPDKKRENPNPAKFNDPLPGKRDVTPKPNIAATAGSALPSAPAGSVNVGVYRQDPNDSNNQPTSYATMQYVAKKASGYSDPIGGVIVVKQAIGPDMATPFVAKVTACMWRPELSPSDPENQRLLIYCEQRNQADKASLDQQFYADGRPKVPLRFEEYMNGGTIIVGEAILFTDQSVPVTITCDPGYTLNQTDINKCDLTNASAVKKPADTTCEMLFDSASKLILTDKANPACDGLDNTTKLSLASSNGTIDVSAKGNGGFDVCVKRPDGGKGCVDTGIYDPGTGGYVIVNTTVTPPPDPNTGLGCGGPGQGACQMVASSNTDMYDKDVATRASIDQANSGLKGKMDNIDPNKFQWSFIPQIPTTACSNPSLRNPVTGGPVEMDICGGFNKFTFFLNAVLAIACVYGCVRQVQNAMKA
ncbi:hypothetical protein [Rugamonas sp. DEMB1]|uniref:hypothetical protein n=1 Tax=Rugamonas sp. DEMB1 TaxID=3039386 RepID=UPI002448A9F8|nr:hypothetical protein [Rugamonas sp. DEMB1]WGG50324.1 hypothetical protein QC826_28550 [Rugamonas sp. DEMB1]